MVHRRVGMWVLAVDRETLMRGGMGGDSTGRVIRHGRDGEPVRRGS